MFVSTFKQLSNPVFYRKIGQFQFVSRRLKTNPSEPNIFWAMIFENLLFVPKVRESLHTFVYEYKAAPFSAPLRYIRDNI